MPVPKVGVKGVEFAVTEESILSRGLSVVELVAVFTAVPFGSGHISEIHGVTDNCNLMLGERRATFIIDRWALDFLEVIGEVLLEVLNPLVSIKGTFHTVWVCAQDLF